MYSNKVRYPVTKTEVLDDVISKLFGFLKIRYSVTSFNFMYGPSRRNNAERGIASQEKGEGGGKCETGDR
jgi:hypothetical protein